MGRLSKREIDGARTDGADLFLWDTSLPGFGLRVKSTGTKSFILQYRNRYGRSRRVTLGRYGTLTLDEARREARRLLSSAVRGKDPRQDRVTDRAALSVADLAERYMTDHCEGRCKDSTMAAHRWLLRKFILPNLGGMAVTEVQQSDVDQLHQSLKETPYNANRTLGLLKAMFGRAEIWGLIPPRSNPAAGVRPFRERKRQRFLSPEELERLARSLDEAERCLDITPQVAAAFRLLILTGARLDEIRTLRWDDIDWSRRLLLLREHKTDDKGAKTIPLSEPAIALLEALAPIPHNPFVIAGRNPGQPVVNLQKPWRRVRDRAGLNDVRIHDLRHSFASFGIGAGISLPLIGGLLGHRSMAATSVYAHLAADPLRQMSELIGQVIAEKLLAGRELQEDED